MPSWAIAPSTLRSRPSSTISEPRCVTSVRGTPCSAYQVSWVEIQVWALA